MSGTPFEAVIHTVKMKRMSAKNIFFHQYAVNNFDSSLGGKRAVASVQELFPGTDGAVPSTKLNTARWRSQRVAAPP